MSRIHKSSTAPRVIAGTLVLLIGGYVGAYYGMAYPSGSRSMPRLESGIRPQVGLPIYLLGREHYPRLDRGTVPFFAPIHWLDRRIRPHFWDPTP